MTRIRKNPDIRRNEILDNSHLLFIKYGFMNVSINDIAKNVGIARTTFYEYYTDKIQILVDIVDRAIITFKIDIPNGDDFYQNLLDLAKNILEKVDSNREIYGLIFREAPILSNNVADKIMSWRYKNDEIVKKIMEDADRDGLLHEDVSIDEAIFVFTALLGQRVGDILIKTEEINVDREADEIVKIIWRCVSK